MRSGRWISIFLAAAMVASILGAPPLAAQEAQPVRQVEEEDRSDEPVLPSSEEPVVRTAVSGSKSRVESAAPVDGLPESVARSGWVVAEPASVKAQSGKKTQVGKSPVSVQVAADEDAVGGGDVLVNVLPPGLAKQLSPVGAAASVAFRNGNGVKVQPNKPYTLELDLSQVAYENTGDLFERLAVSIFDGCELFEPDLSVIEDSEIDPAEVEDLVVCDDVVELPADFDAESETLTVKVNRGQIQKAQNEKRNALLKSGVKVADLNPKNGLKLSVNNGNGALRAEGPPGQIKNADENVTGPKGKSAMVLRASQIPAGLLAALQAGGGSDPIVGVTTNASSSSGDFSALPVPTLTDAQVGLYTGSAELSYPIPVPAAAAGPAPSVSLNYSSASVDGMTMGTNNQTGPLGTGWSLSAGGSIQRGLKACNDPAAAGDRCISGSPDDVYTMSLAGRSSKLIFKNSGTVNNADFKEFRLQSDPFWRIRLWTGTSEGVTVNTKDAFNHWWSVETPDGTVYTLGTTNESMDWVPVWYPSGTNPCGDTYRLCDTARQWNVDTVTDAFGNEMVYEYGQEHNWYNARGINTTYKRQYVRASRVEAITYGAHPGLGRPANARIDLNYEWRCNTSSAFSDCGVTDGEDDEYELPANMNDVPNDLWCGPHAEANEYPTVCTEKSPTFWTQLRFTGALSQVSDENGGWVTTAYHDPEQSWVRDTSTSFLHSKLQLVLNSMSERPIDANGTNSGGDYQRSGFDPIQAMSHDADQGVATNTTIHDVGFEGVATSFGNDDWVRFDDVWMGDSNNPATSITLRASAIRTGNVEIRVGSPTGTVIGTVVIPATTGGSKDFKSFTANITPTSGVKTVYLRGERPSSQTIGFINWFQFGRNTIADLPEVAQATFNAGGYDFRNNRLNSVPGTSLMRFPRIKTFTNQLGGTVNFTYGQDHPCTPGVAVPPGSWDNNHLDCFPQWDTSTNQPGWTIFNKWVVKFMSRGDTFSQQPDVHTRYVYTKPGWGFADNPDSSHDTWNEFRGYNKVLVDVIDNPAASNPTVLTRSEHRFHQGLHGEPKVGSGTNSETVARSNGSTITDTYALRGMTYETRQLDGATAITRNWTNYANNPTTSDTGRLDPRFVAPSQTESQVDGTANTKTAFSYNDWGATTAVREYGNTANENLPPTNPGFDNRTTVTSYYPANTNNGLGNWRTTFPCVTGLRAGTTNTGAPSPSSASGLLRWSRNLYDGNTNLSAGCTTAVNKPVVRRSSTATSNTGRVTTVIGTDSRGRVSAVTDPKGNTSTNIYFKPNQFDHGQLTQAKNAAPFNWVSETVYDAWRRPVQQIDVNLRSSYTTYDEYSRVTAISNPHDASENADTVKVTYSPALLGPAYTQVQTRLDGNAYTNSATFVDGFGRTVLNRTLGPYGGSNRATAQQYDNVGRQYRSSAQYGISADNVTLFDYPDWGSVPSFGQTEYDKASRPTESRTMKGVSGTISESFSTSTDYIGFRTRFFDQKNQWTDSVVDGLGRTSSVVEQQGSPNITTSYEYNLADDLTKVIAPDGLETVIVYDHAGRKKTTTDPDSGEWSYTYDANSNLTTQTDPSGDVSSFWIDNLNRRTRQYVNGSLRGQWLYDPTNNKGLMWDARQYQNPDDAGNNQGVVYQRQVYDVWGRKTQDQTLIPDPNTSNLLRMRSVYTLRDDGQRSSINHPSGTYYQYGYRVNYGFNPRTGQAETLAENGGSGQVIVSDVNWNQAGQVFEHKYGSGALDAKQQWLYDANTLRLNAVAFGTNNWVTRHGYHKYTHDDNANIVKVEDWYNSHQHQCFTYDKLDRLLTAYTDTSACNGHTATGAGNYDHAYTYNRGGNITSKTGAGAGTHNGNYTYDFGNNGNHRVTSTSDGSTFDYNANGDMILRNLAGKPAQTLEWDKGRRLERVKEGNTEVAEFLYGIDDTRVRRKTDGTYTYYHADGTQYTHDGTTGVFTYYHQISGKTVAYTTSNDSKTTWMYSDQINSTGVTRDQNGVAKTQRYTPWGELRTTGNLTTDKHFTGQTADQTTGLAFYNARYYDPAIGRFISPDSIVPDSLNGQDYNRYSYVMNNPIRYSDPTGHFAFAIPIVYAAVTAMLAGTATVVAVDEAYGDRTLSTAVGNASQNIVTNVADLISSQPDSTGQVTGPYGTTTGTTTYQPGVYGPQIVVASSADDPDLSRVPPTAASSPALPTNPWNPAEVDRRRSGRRAELGLNRDPDTPIPDQSPGSDQGGHPARTRRSHDGQKNVGGEQEHSRNAKGNPLKPNQRGPY